MATVVKLERGPRGLTALARIKEEIEALPRTRVLRVNLEVQKAISTVLGVVPEVQAVRAQVVRELPTFDLANIDKLALFAEALHEAQARLILNTVPKADQRRSLLPEAKRLRTLLHAIATALKCRGSLRPTALNKLKRGTGFNNLSYDLLLLASTLRAAWSKVEKSYPMPVEDLELASKLALALRDTAPTAAAVSSFATAQDLRARVFTLLMVAYNEVRRAVAYLRPRHADSIAPCLYEGRPRRRAQRGKRAVTSAKASRANGKGPTAEVAS